MNKLPEAVFLDRDGTIMEDAHYIKSPDQVRLIPGAAAAVKRINDAKVPAIVVTNQSGLARGIFKPEDYEAVRRHFESLLHAEGAHIDASYFCPHHPSVTGPCDCRKPATGMFEDALRDFGLDAANVAYVGDRWRDVVASKKLGGRGIMISSHMTTDEDRRKARADGIETAPTLAAAVELLFRSSSHQRFRVKSGMPSRLAVLASGRGSNLQAIIDHFDNLARERIAKVVLVASNRPDSPALIRAATASIDIAPFSAGDDGSALLQLLREFRIDLVVLAGYLKRIPPKVIREYAGRILNIHPALLPAFGGEGMYGARVHEAVIASGAEETGVTVHLVDDEYDRGPIIAQWRVPVEKSDTAETLAARVLNVEHVVYPRAVEMVAILQQLEQKSPV